MMLPSLLLLGLFFLGVYSLMHLLVSRYARPAQRWLAMKRIYFFFVPVVAASGYCVAEHTEYVVREWPEVLAIALLVWLIHVGYLTVYSFIDRSITLRTFIEIESFAGQPATFEQIEARYNPADAFERRLAILLEAGFLNEESGGNFVLTPKGRRTGRLIGFLKTIYRMGPGG